jgi:hypothetical protein
MKNSKDRFQYNGDYEQYEKCFSEQFIKEEPGYVNMCYSLSLIPEIAIEIYRNDKIFNL